MASPMLPNPASPARGPVWPKPEMWTTTSAGLSADSTSYVEAPLVEPSGAEVLDHDVAVRPRAGG